MGWKKQKIVIELKIKQNQNSLQEGLQQTADYMDIVNATEGHLIIFDRDPNLSWDDKISDTIESVAKKSIHVWRL